MEGFLDILDFNVHLALGKLPISKTTYSNKSGSCLSNRRWAAVGSASNYCWKGDEIVPTPRSNSESCSLRGYPIFWEIVYVPEPKAIATLQIILVT